jgi:hypothetical protein
MAPFVVVCLAGVVEVLWGWVMCSAAVAEAAQVPFGMWCKRLEA